MGQEQIITQDFKKILLTEDFKEIIGQENTKEEIKSAFLAGRHVIILGQPGIGKTTLARNISQLIPEKTVNTCGYNCDPKDPVCPTCLTGKKSETKKISGENFFVRVQGSPDLTAEDLIGDLDPIKALKYGPTSLEAFTPGKIFKANQGILFFDEINRCSEKLQNTLLQVLEEGKVTLGSYTLDLKANFIFIGTMNPDDTSTEPLSDVFVDRFDLVYMKYPESADIEKEIVSKHGQNLMTFPDWLLNSVVRFIQDLRHDDNLEKKPGVRATLGLYERSQTRAMLKGKKEVDMEDVQAVMQSVLAHRIKLKPSLKYLKTNADYIREEFLTFCKRGDYL